MNNNADPAEKATTRAMNFSAASGGKQKSHRNDKEGRAADSGSPPEMLS